MALSTRALIDTADVELSRGTATVTWEVPASGTLGMRTRYDIHDRGTDPTFANQTDYDASDGGFTISSVPPRSMVSVELTPYSGWTGSAVSGSAGDIVIVEAVAPKAEPGGPPIQRNPRVLIRTSIDDSSEAVVFVGAPEEAVAVYVTVGDGSDPSDPTSSTNDGSTTGPTGVVDTGVSITPGNDAHVKAVWEDAYGSVSLVAEERSTWNDVFPGEQITGTNPIFSGIVDILAGAANRALRLFTTGGGGHITFHDTADGSQRAAFGYTGPTNDRVLLDTDRPIALETDGDNIDLDPSGGDVRIHDELDLIDASVDSPTVSSQGYVLIRVGGVAYYVEVFS